MKQGEPDEVVIQRSFESEVERDRDFNESVPETLRSYHPKFSKVSNKYPPSKIPEFLKRDLPYKVLLETGLIDETEEEYDKRMKKTVLKNKMKLDSSAHLPSSQSSQRENKSKKQVLTPRQKYEAAREANKPQVMQGVSYLDKLLFY